MTEWVYTFVDGVKFVVMTVDKKMTRSEAEKYRRAFGPNYTYSFDRSDNDIARPVIKKPGGKAGQTKV